jgi:hypothetical protein
VDAANRMQYILENDYILVALSSVLSTVKYFRKNVAMTANLTDEFPLHRNVAEWVGGYFRIFNHIANPTSGTHLYPAFLRKLYFPSDRRYYRNVDIGGEIIRWSEPCLVANAFAVFEKGGFNRQVSV